MYGGMSHKLSMLRKKSTADIIPDPIDWPNVVGFTESNVDTVNQTISGISESITLGITYYDNIAGSAFYYSKNDGEWTFIGGPPASPGATFTLQMSNNDTLKFRYNSSIRRGVLTVTVKNNSDSFTTLDTFTITTEQPA